MVADKSRSIKVVELYYSNGRSITKTMRAYRLETKKKIPRQSLYEIIEKFTTTGNLASDMPRSGRPIEKRTPRNIKKILKRLEDSPRRSARRLSRETGLSNRTVIKGGFGIFPL